MQEYMGRSPQGHLSPSQLSETTPKASLTYPLNPFHPRSPHPVLQVCTGHNHMHTQKWGLGLGLEWAASIPPLWLCSWAAHLLAPADWS